MVQYFAASLRQHGAGFSDARIVVSVGEDCEPYDLAAATPQLAEYGITWRWVDRELFRRHSYYATCLDRFAEPFEADFVLMADADILITGDCSDLLAQLEQPRGIAGVIATYPPWLGRNKGDVDRERWGEMFALAGLQQPIFDCPHPGHGVYYPAGSGMETGPAYYNFGFVLGTRDAMNAIAGTFPQDFLLALDFMQTDLCCQAGLALSIIRNAVRYRTLPVRYNFWADPRYHQAFPDDAADMRILHYLNGPFRKHYDNEGTAEIAAWLHAHRNDQDAHTQFIHHAVSRAHAAVMAKCLEPAA
jgi:lipopolysaccharide biosynthesis glycosyltransferase